MRIHATVLAIAVMLVLGNDCAVQFPERAGSTRTGASFVAMIILA